MPRDTHDYPLPDGLIEAVLRGIVIERWDSGVSAVKDLLKAVWHHQSPRSRQAWSAAQREVAYTGNRRFRGHWSGADSDLKALTAAVAALEQSQLGDLRRQVSRLARELEDSRRQKEGAG